MEAAPEPLEGDTAAPCARRALGAVCGVVGVHVVLRGLSFFTMAMTHATFPGVVLAAIVGIDLLLGSGLFGILVVLGVAWLSSRPRSDPSAAVGVVLSAGFALGVVLLSARAGFTRDLSAYLVGSILTVRPSDLVKTAVVLVVVLVVLAAVGKELVFGAFDRGGLVALGYPVRRLDLLLLLLIEVTVVISVPAVGTILAVALVVAPAATARLWCDRVGRERSRQGRMAAGCSASRLAIAGWRPVEIVLVASASSWYVRWAPRAGRTGPVWTGPGADPTTGVV